jgi:aspartyl-tRNA(Asn)/glutamyl-tRNA(Gln) amidotransferase subunit C
MALTENEVRHIAHLARLAVADAELPAVAAKLSRIVGFVEQLTAADTAGVAPMAHPLDERQRLRPDAVTEPDVRAAAQPNAPAVDQGLYLVPRVIE